MTVPQAGAHDQLTDGGTEVDPYRDGVIAYGHPRGALRAIPRYPLSTADYEAMVVAFSVAKGTPDNSGRGYPVKQGGIPAYGT